MQNFGSTNDWKRLIWPVLILVGLCATPFTLFLIHVAIDSKDLQYTLTTSVMLLVLWLCVLRHLHTVYLFPFIQVDENYLVVCQLFSRRKVYNLKSMANSKRFLKSIYFAHNGWPVFINLHTLSQQEREKLWSLLERF